MCRFLCMPSSPPSSAFLGHRVLWSCTGGRRPTDSTIDTAFPARFSGESLLFPPELAPLALGPPPPLHLPLRQSAYAGANNGAPHATRAQWRRRSFPRGERLILPASKHWVNISHSESLSFDTFYFVFWIGTLAQGDFLRIFSFFSFFFIAIFLLSLIEFCRNWSIRGTSWGLLTRFFVTYCATMGCK